MIQESKELCPIETYLSFGRSKLLHSCSYFMLKSEPEQTVIACLAGRNAQEVFYSGFVLTPSGDSRRFLSGICNADPQDHQAYSGTSSRRNFRRLKATLGKFGQNVARLKAI